MDSVKVGAELASQALLDFGCDGAKTKENLIFADILAQKIDKSEMQENFTTITNQNEEDLGTAQKVSQLCFFDEAQTREIGPISDRTRYDFDATLGVLVQHKKVYSDAARKTDIEVASFTSNLNTIKDKSCYNDEKSYASLFELLRGGQHIGSSEQLYAILPVYQMSQHYMCVNADQVVYSRIEQNLGGIEPLAMMYPHIRESLQSDASCAYLVSKIHFLNEYNSPHAVGIIEGVDELQTDAVVDCCQMRCYNVTPNQVMYADIGCTWGGLHVQGKGELPVGDFWGRGIVSQIKCKFAKYVAVSESDRVICLQLEPDGIFGKVNVKYSVDECKKICEVVLSTEKFSTAYILNQGRAELVKALREALYPASLIDVKLEGDIRIGVEVIEHANNERTFNDDGRLAEDRSEHGRHRDHDRHKGLERIASDVMERDGASDIDELVLHVCYINSLLNVSI